MHRFVTLLLFILSLQSFGLQSFAASKSGDDDLRLKILTIASEETDGFRQFMRSAKQFGIDVEVLGLGKPWKGGDMLGAGGGVKISFLKEALEQYKSEEKLIIMFTDAYDVIFNAPGDEILRRFRKNFPENRVIFSAEGFCWPDKSLAVKYPVVRHGKRYLCSGLFMGYAKEIYDIVSHKAIKDTDDDQLYYTEIFLDKDLREKFRMGLDNMGKIFQNLNGATEDVHLTVSDDHYEVHNIAYNTRPCVIHGNGPSKLRLNQLGNYIGKSYSPSEGCIACKEDRILLKDKDVKDLPLVVLAIFIEKPTPFLSEFFERLAALNYPKSQMYIFLHNKEAYHADQVAEFVNKYENDYVGSELILPAAKAIDERTARNDAMEYCIDKSCDYLFAVDAEAQITNPNTLRALIEQNRKVLAPLLGRPGKLWSNFWGSLSEDGFYARSDDYSEIIQFTKTGVWNVPFLGNAYLIKREALDSMKECYSHNLNLDPDMSFCSFCRDKGVFMYVDNQEVYGHLINTDGYDPRLTNPDMYELFDNRLDWELKYMHENYSKIMEPDTKVDQPCPDVYYFPLFSEKFCRDLVKIMENFGQWSNGETSDPRLAGGYENVPTRDIHMNQVDFERHWLHILDTYVRPMQEKVFIGFYQVPARAIMNFVVRYRPDEQPELRPHHDSSTFTINIALNRQGMDYEGGGARFIRYDCAVRGQKQGWSLMHPGRLTHYHEGLPTTKGTRYIMVSFVNP